MHRACFACTSCSKHFFRTAYRSNHRSRLGPDLRVLQLPKCHLELQLLLLQFHLQGSKIDRPAQRRPPEPAAGRSDLAAPPLR